MAVSKGVARFLRVSPRKVRQVINLVRGKGVLEAEEILKVMPRQAALPVRRLLVSALSYAKTQKNAKPEELFIGRISADGGPVLKRFRAGAMGRATRIRRPMTHLTIELERKS